MDKQKLTKRFTVFAVALSSVAFLGSSAIGLWQLIQAPLPIRMPSHSAQAKSQANSALEILRNKPQDADANKSLEFALQYFAEEKNISQLIQTLETHQKIAPNGPNASRYQEILTKLKSLSSPTKTNPSPGISDKANKSKTSPEKQSDK